MPGSEAPSSIEQEEKVETTEVSEQQQKNLEKVSGEELSNKLNQVETPEAFDLSRNIQTLGDITLSSQVRNDLAESTLMEVIASPDLLPIYLGHLKPDTLRYLGSDTQTQIKLYNTLIASPSCKALAPEGSDLQKNLFAVRMAIDSKNTLSLNEQMKELSNQGKEKIKEFFDQFGGALLSVANFFGGKDALKGFFKKFNIDVGGDIDTLYKDTYEVKADKLNTIYNAYTGTTEQIQAYYSSDIWLESNFLSLDPSLVDQANKASLNIPDLVIANGSKYGEPIYKINPNINLTSGQKQNIITKILDNFSLEKTIGDMSDPANADKLYGEDNPKRAENWYTKCPDLKNPKECAVVLGAYLMKGSKDLTHVLDESQLPYEAEHKTKRANEHNKTTEVSDKPSNQVEELKKNWNTLFVDLDTGKRKYYPLTSDQENDLSEPQKTSYKEYKTAIAGKISALVNPNVQDLSSVLQDPALKEKITPFLTKHFTIYLNSLKDSPAIYTGANTKAIDGVIDKFTTITTGLSISLNDKGELSVSGKDSKKPPTDITIKPTEFSWFPTKKIVDFH